MKLVDISLPETMLDTSDKALGAAARVRMNAAIATKRAGLEAGRDKTRKKLGTPIVIDGRRFDSRAQACKELGISFYMMAKKYPQGA